MTTYLQKSAGVPVPRKSAATLLFSVFVCLFFPKANAGSFDAVLLHVCLEVSSVNGMQLKLIGFRI